MKQNFKHPIYQQLWGRFSPNLRIIDLLFNMGSDNLRIIKLSISNI